MLYTFILSLQLLSDTDNEVKALVEKFDFYMLPIANPDGYEYTHTGVSHAPQLQGIIVISNANHLYF